MTRLLPCSHEVCATCAPLAVFARGMKCPLCRTSVHGVAQCDAVGGQYVTIALGGGVHAGVTLGNHAHGVCLLGVTKGDAADLHHLQAGSVLTHLNGIPAVSHWDTVRIINDCTERGVPVVVRLGRLDCEQRRRLARLRALATAHHDADRRWIDGHTDPTPRSQTLET